MKSLSILLLLLVPTTIAAQDRTAATTIKVKVEAQETSRSLLLERLQAQGKNLGLAWQESAGEFDYHILFATHDENNMRVFWWTGKAIVQAPDGKELFQFTQGGWSRAAVADSIARGIIERLLRLRPDLRRKSGTSPVESHSSQECS